jgi:hypothetical protein
MGIADSTPPLLNSTGTGAPWLGKCPVPSKSDRVPSKLARVPMCWSRRLSSSRRAPTPPRTGVPLNLIRPGQRLGIRPSSMAKDNRPAAAVDTGEDDGEVPVRSAPGAGSRPASPPSLLMSPRIRGRSVRTQPVLATRARNRRSRPPSFRSGTPPSAPTWTRSPSRNDDPIDSRCLLFGSRRDSSPGGDGLAFGAAAGTLHPAADRPLSRLGGRSRGARRRVSRALRGPSDRPAGPPLTRPRRRGPCPHAVPGGARAGRPAATRAIPP